MPKVTLAYPFNGHDPDETIDLDDDTAGQLIRDGRARLVEPKPAKAVASVPVGKAKA